MTRCGREFFPIINVKTSLGKSVGMTIGDTTVNVSVHEDNTSDLVLARTFPPQFNLCRNYYVTKAIWFFGYIVKRGIKHLKIDTVEYLGGLFTKGLPITAF